MTINASETITQFADMISILANAEKQLEKHVEGLTSANLKPGGTEADILNVLQALKDGLTKFTANLLNTSSTGANFESLIFAIKLVETYLQNTDGLSQNLAVLQKLDNTASQASYSGNPALPTECSSDTNLYKAFNCVRDSLKQKLDDTLGELNLSSEEVDITSLLQESQKILELLEKLPSNPLSKDVSAIIDRFIKHLDTAYDTFKKFEDEDVSLDEQEVKNLKKLLNNWSAITAKLQSIPVPQNSKSDSKNLMNIRAVIAQTVQIHEQLEQIYDLLITLVRSGDLESAGIL